MGRRICATLRGLLSRGIPVLPLVEKPEVIPAPVPAEFQGRRIRAWADDRVADDMLRALGLLEHYIYQIVVFGPNAASYQTALGDAIEEDLRGLGLDPQTDLMVFDPARAGDLDFKGGILALWMGGTQAFPNEAAELAVLKTLADRSVPIVTCVSRVTNVGAELPEPLRKLNAAARELEESPGSKVFVPNALVSGDVLRWLGLIREERQAFISYRRAESVGVAHQLFHVLTDRGYRVFLDTASVERAVPFQQVLHDRLADTDLIVLLDSPTVLNSQWVREELDVVRQARAGRLPALLAGDRRGRQRGPRQERPDEAEASFDQGDRVQFPPRTPSGGPRVADGVGRPRGAAPRRRVKARGRPRRAGAGEVSGRAFASGWCRTSRTSASRRADCRQRAGPPGRAAPRVPPSNLVATAYAIPGLPNAWDIYRWERKIADTNYGTWDATHYTAHRIVFDGLGILGERREHLEYLNKRLYLQTLATQALHGWFGTTATAGAPASGVGGYVTAGDLAALAGPPPQSPEDGGAAMTSTKPPVFLSASVPERDLWLYKPEPVAILEAVRALVAVVVRDRELVFGGHPAISPMVENAARTLPKLAAPDSGEPPQDAGVASRTAADNVFIYQSEYFRDMIPPASEQFTHLIWTDRDPHAPDDRKACLLKMRREMIESKEFAAGIFVGGMDGVEEEWALFGDIHPKAPRFPVASTLGAALLLWRDHVLPWLPPADPDDANRIPTPGERLKTDLQYRLLFHDLLDSPAVPP